MMILVVARGFIRCACCLPEYLNRVTWMFLGSAKVLIHCKKNIFKIYYHNTFSFVKSTSVIYLFEITYYFEFLVIKLISFIVLTHFLQFNQLIILRQPRY